MNVQKIVSGIVILVSMSAGVLASAASPSKAGPLPSVSSALPDTLPLDMSHAGSFEHTEPTIVTTSAITIFGTAPKAPGKVWTCGAFRQLGTDATATVRECEWK